MPGVGKEYEPNIDLLKGVAISVTSVSPIHDQNDNPSTTMIHDDADNNDKNELYWKYFPKELLPSSSDADKFSAIFNEQEKWTLEELEQYFDKARLKTLLLKHTRQVETDDGTVYVSK